ncbi:MAG: tRNA 2-thiouridine(34) synthase MnmA, partial [Phycisphaerae bacterium]|nr:tRNA 2-thiouridine(34) synthase MnmA [Phycisphaerae bacterium]
CNDWLKFGKLHEYAQQIDAAYVASGHYARVDHDAGEPRLLRGVDHDKDQSYVLFGIPAGRLREMLLPVGGLTKPRVRAIAAKRGLPVFDKPDSQEICFVPDNDYAGLVERRSPAGLTEGPVVDTAGNPLGTHPGHQHFTIGQRRGVGVALGYPIYVVNKDPDSNTITVGGKDDLLATACTAAEANWLVEPPDAWRPCTVKVRYNAAPVTARVRAQAPDRLEVAFDTPQSAVAPGQAVVCFDGDRVIGGGWIDASTPATRGARERSSPPVR